MKYFLLLFLFIGTFFSSFEIILASEGSQKSISSSEIVSVLSDAAIEGSTGATITVVEYSDMECPFCIKLHNDIQLWKKIHAKYGSDVNYVFKNNRGINHKHTEKKAITAICVKKIKGNNAYIRFYNEVLEKSSIQRVYPISRIGSFLRSEKISLLQYNRCMKDPAAHLQFDHETDEAQKFDLGGTPGILIINQKTQMYDTVLGAYPIETFYETIDALLK